MASEGFEFQRKFFSPEPQKFPEGVFIAQEGNIKESNNELIGREVA